MQTVAILDVEKNIGYGQLSIPDVRDEQIAQLIANVLDTNALSEFSRKIELKHWDVLLCFAERAATLAVRRQDRKLLKLGLVAAGLVWPVADWRDVLVVLPVLYHAAGMLGMDPAQLFHEVGSLFGGEVEAELTGFLERSDEDKSLAVMGYKLIREPDGVRFKRTW